MWITQEKYLEAANRNYKEWFVDNSYDVIFVPLVARDYLTAYLLNFEDISFSAPDLDYVLELLAKYDDDIVKKYSDLNIKFSEEVMHLDYYLPLLSKLKDFVNKELEELNRKDFEWVDEFVSFKIKENIYILKRDYPNNIPKKHLQLLKAVANNYLKILLQEEKCDET